MEHPCNCNYHVWLRSVDELLEMEYGVGSSDLEDFTWIDCYDDGCAPSDAVEEFKDSDYAPR